MVSIADTARHALPGRFERPSALAFLLYALGIALIVWAIDGSGWSIEELGKGIPSLADFLSRCWPPSFERIDSLSKALIETFQMAVSGTLTGIILALPLSILAARGLTGSRIFGSISRGLFALFRTVPDLVWALIFVIAVGLGPFAGTLAIAVDTAGFAGRFFAEAMEDVDKGPADSLRAQGVRRSDAIFCSIIPAAMPSFITTSLFALEKSVRSSVILGLVGAGGIGLELKVATDMFDYQTAATIILLIFALVLVVEQAGSFARKRVIEG
ncbi:phosphonate ABC transporter, permease protein PhnE [Terrihabitans soli]|uniref:Phosphonate ABC transporter, permease protein PhnE n=1 Tax=Terrihabitans soli TaxID=708113 RepID=A0A6S6QF13_9HYPH|nr:phosphonate ABC transporter, permease protein PhnE [Terrihabitans soli]BCJ89683.1 phosphonate ABC transporter, permease protein PhnE [Terrihabitans soli]